MCDRLVLEYHFNVIVIRVSANRRLSRRDFITVADHALITPRLIDRVVGEKFINDALDAPPPRDSKQNRIVSYTRAIHTLLDTC